MAEPVYSAPISSQKQPAVKELLRGMCRYKRACTLSESLSVSYFLYDYFVVLLS